MSGFEKWLDTNELDEEWHNTHNACDYARAAYAAGAAEMRERCAFEAEKQAGYMSYPVECGPEDYYTHAACLGLAGTILKIGER